MSTLLEQAIIDAEALKEAAIKNAEATIIEKYSVEVKDAVQSLLEQPGDEFDLGLGADMGEEPAETSPVLDEVPYSVEEGEDPIMVRLDLEALERALDDEGVTEAEETHEDLADSLEEEIASESADEEIELDEEILKDLAEELKVDLTIPDQGLGGRTTPTALRAHGEEVQAAVLQDDEVSEEQEALAKAQKELNLYREQVDKLRTHNKKLEKIVLNLKGRLEEVNLSNAKLLYTNRVLNSTSLNERQKTKIVESISNSDSVEAAKVIYETLQSAVGAEQTRGAPKSLREVVERPSATLPRKRETNVQNPVYNRMRALAGIIKEVK